MASQNKSKEIKKDKRGYEIGDLRDKVTVVATGKALFHKEGEEYMCHPKIAELIVKRGFAKFKSDGKVVKPKDTDGDQD